jgi:uncharacterized membrane protein
MNSKISLSAWLAIGSGFLNAFLLGLILAHGILHGPPSFMPPVGGAQPFVRMEAALQKIPAADREKVQAIINKEQDGMFANVGKMTGTFSEIDAVLTAPKFDESKLHSLHKQIEDYDHAMKGNMLEFMIEIAKALPDQDRIEFFKEMSHENMGHHGPMPPM